MADDMWSYATGQREVEQVDHAHEPVVHRHALAAARQREQHQKARAGGGHCGREVTMALH